MMPNLYADLPKEGLPDELFATLLSRDGIRIERIVSTGHASPPGFWYDQPEEEWVVLLTGAAALRFEDETDVRQLKPGDWIFIDRHRRHRVDWTDPGNPTVWLAVYFSRDTG